MSIITPVAQDLLDRLARMNLEEPRNDRDAIERAFAAHLEALGLPARRIVYAEDPETACALIEGRTTDPAYRAARREATKEAETIAEKGGAAEYAELLAPDLADTDAGAQAARWLALEIRLEPLHYVLSFVLTFIAALLTRSLEIAVVVALGSHVLSTLLVAVFSPRARKTLGPIAFDLAREAIEEAPDVIPYRRCFYQVWFMAPLAWDRIQPSGGAVEDAETSIGQINGLAILAHTDAVRLTGIWLRVVEALEAGVYRYWVFPSEIVCILQPGLTISENNVHCLDGPAVRWPSGEVYYAWNGARIPATLALRTEPPTIEMIREQAQHCVRSVLLEQFRAASPTEAELRDAIRADRQGVGREALTVARSVRAPDPTSPRHDMSAVEQAVTLHLLHAGLQRRPFTWFDDHHAVYRHFKAEVHSVLNPGWSRLVESVIRHRSGAGWGEAYHAGIAMAEATFQTRAWHNLEYAAMTRVPGWWGARPSGCVVEDVETYVGLLNGLRAARTPELEKLVEMWTPMLTAFEAGLWWYWILDDRVICILRPSLMVENGRLHCATGPAVRWRSGACQYFWRGVPVPAEVIEAPDRITVGMVREQSNQEVRRCLIEIYGRSRYFRDSGARLVHEDAYGGLWETDAGDEVWRFVEVENGTPEPDGTRRMYTLDVTSAEDWIGQPIETAHAAVAATYGLRPEEYRPEIRT